MKTNPDSEGLPLPPNWRSIGEVERNLPRRCKSWTLNALNDFSRPLNLCSTWNTRLQSPLANNEITTKQLTTLNLAISIIKTTPETKQNRDSSQNLKSTQAMFSSNYQRMPPSNAERISWRTERNRGMNTKSKSPLILNKEIRLICGDLEWRYIASSGRLSRSNLAVPLCQKNSVTLPTSLVSTVFGWPPPPQLRLLYQLLKKKNFQRERENEESQWRASMESVHPIFYSTTWTVFYPLSSELCSVTLTIFISVFFISFFSIRYL